MEKREPVVVPWSVGRHGLEAVDFYLERVAVLEADAGLPDWQAEAQAIPMTLEWMKGRK